MSYLGYADLLRLLAEVQRIGQVHTLKICLEAAAGSTPPRGGEGAVPGGTAAPAATMFDAIRTNGLLYEETQRLSNLLLARLDEVQRTARPAAADAAPRSWTEEEIIGLLNGAQMALIKHPAAVQAAFSALVREGRRFAETEEGGKWLEALGKSSFMRRARWVWETTSLNMLEEDSETIVPSTYLEALLRATEVPDLEQLLGRVTGMGHE